MAAEAASASGARVSLYEGKSSVGRKFLIAGKSGLNLTNTEPWTGFRQRYSGTNLPDHFASAILDSFDATALREWVHGFGIDTFSVRSGKVFPRPMKAAPLLRAWIGRLKERGVEFYPKHRLVELSSNRALKFETSEGAVEVQADAIILALGGASWSRTGSDGRWTEILKPWAKVEPWQAANCGWECDMPDELRQTIEGQPLKNLRLSSSAQTETGELMPTRYGFEGTPLYALGPKLRNGTEAMIEVDFKPMFTAEQLEKKMESVKAGFIEASGQRWKLSPAAQALLSHFHGPFESARALAAACKKCRIPLTRPRPIEEAISSAGGLSWESLETSLMLRELPGIFACGEMLDWEAPTGGYLLQACFASGRFAGENASNWLKNAGFSQK